MMGIREAFEGHFVLFATVDDSYRAHVPGCPLYVLNDCTRWDRAGMMRTAAQVLRLLLRERPDVVVSTGALPGFFAVVLGRMLGAKTIWLDSLANVEELSMSGQKVARWADLWLTQWPTLAKPEGPEYAGSVLG